MGSTVVIPTRTAPRFRVYPLIRIEASSGLIFILFGASVFHFTVFAVKYKGNPEFKGYVEGVGLLTERKGFPCVTFCFKGDPCQFSVKYSIRIE